MYPSNRSYCVHYPKKLLLHVLKMQNVFSSGDGA